MHVAIARTGAGARLAAISCGAMAILASAAVSGCSGSTPRAARSSIEPAVSASPTPGIFPRRTASTSERPTTSPPTLISTIPSLPVGRLPSATPATGRGGRSPTAAPAPGGGGTAGLQDPLLLAFGGAAMLAGAGSLAYRRKATRDR